MPRTKPPKKSKSKHSYGNIDRVDNQINSPQNKCNIGRLKRYLSIIDDMNCKLFTARKYPDYLQNYGTESTSIEDLIDEIGPVSELRFDNELDSHRKAELWQTVDSLNWQDSLDLEEIEFLEEGIIAAYQSWAEWICDSEYSDMYAQFVQSLHPATLNVLPKLIPNFQTPKQIRAFRFLDILYQADDKNDNEFYFPTLSELKEESFYDYQKYLKKQHKLLGSVIKFIQDEKIKGEVWPREWMKNNKAIWNRLQQLRPFIPILNYITEHALHRYNDEGFEMYKRPSDGKKFFYLITKINVKKIANSTGVSEGTVKRYIGSMKKAKFIKALTNPYYAIGYWNNKTRVFFLKNTPRNRRKLIEFSIT